MDQNISNFANDTTKSFFIGLPVKHLLTFDAKWAFLDHQGNPVISCPSPNASDVFDSSASVEPWLGALPLSDRQHRCCLVWLCAENGQVGFSSCKMEKVGEGGGGED